MLRIYIIDPLTSEEIEPEKWLNRAMSQVAAAQYIVFRGIARIRPFKISKDNLYEKCASTDFVTSKLSAGRSGSRLGTVAEWAIVHDAKIHHGLDRILMAINGDVIGCKPTYTESGDIVRSYTPIGHMERFEQGTFDEKAQEIFARRFANIL
jgi:hypothetical protein